MTDYLDEDTPVANQNFAVLSYVLPKEKSKGKSAENSQVPMFKIRGCYKTVEECESRIKKLQNKDSYFNMYVIEVGKWGCLLTDEQLADRDIESVYQNQIMNNMIKEYKDQKDKNDLEFEKRKNHLKEQAIADGTKEGQERLANKKEHFLSVQKRAEESKNFIKELEEQLAEYKEIYTKASQKLTEYSEEEIETMTKDQANLTIN